MIFDASLLNTLHYKLWIRASGAIQGKELCPPLHLDVVAIEKGSFESLLTTIGQLLVFTNGPGEQGSIPSRDILKTKKCYLMHPCLTLSIIRYGS